MRIKRVKIEIKNLDNALKEAGEVFEKLTKGEQVKKKTAIYFDNLSSMRKVLTEKRLEILHTIKEEHPQSIYELAKILGRDLNNVSDDLKYLKELGLVDLRKSKTEREKTIPSVDYDRIQLDIAV